MSGEVLNTITIAEKLPEYLQDELINLRAFFEMDFELWERSEKWNRGSCNGYSTTINENQINEEALNHLLDNAVKERQSIVESLPDNNHLVILPLVCKKKSPIVAIGIDRGTEGKILKKLVATKFELLQEKKTNQNHMVKSTKYAEQVSHDFEELYWLRNLAHHLEYCAVENSIETVADKVLPSLRDIVKTKTLLFYPVYQEKEEYLLKEESEVLHYGDDDYSAEECREIVNQFKERSHKGPVVYNRRFVNQNIEQPDLDVTFALIPVAKGNFIAGYLFALERIVNQSENQIDQLPTSCSECSFGTFEVGLMSACGILLANHARNAHLFEEQKTLTTGVIRSLINSVDSNDPYTCGHSDRVALISKRIAEQFGLNEEECEQIYLSGMLHDIGKIGIPDRVLKKKGKLTDDEYEIIKQHPIIGYSILSHLKSLDYVLPGVLHHHETWDGRGYPLSIAGEDIPLPGRIIAVADAYDAMTSSRPYRSAMPFEKAESILKNGAGSQWDSKLVKCFFEVIEDIHRICNRTEEDTKELFDSECYDHEMQHLDDTIHAAITTTCHE